MALKMTPQKKNNSPLMTPKKIRIRNLRRRLTTQLAHFTTFWIRVNRKPDEMILYRLHLTLDLFGDPVSQKLSFASLGQKSAIYPNIHILKISLFTKFTISKYPFFTILTIWKSHFSQNSQFQSLIFHKIHIFQTSNSW